MEPDRDEDVKARPRSLMPPYAVLRDFLEGRIVADLLDYTLAPELAFEPTKVGRGETATADPALRVSLGTRDLGPFKPILKAKILALVPDLVAKLQTSPVDAPKLELQLVAHNDGAFYKRHIDTQTAAERRIIRLLSGVYYFHSEPKAFGGGALRLFAVGGDGENYVDVEPAHNSLLVFPSWAGHEVMPVSCPSGRFRDSRFAINCWVYRRGAGAGADGDA
jgi:SM-20-related protein